MIITRTGLLAVLWLFLLPGHTVPAAGSWESTLTASSPPSFPNPRPMHAKYGFGWSGFPSATDPYLATVTVLGRERVTIPAGTYNAIKFDLQLNRIKDGQLQPHRKFRRANVWLSDDPDRLLLKIEAQVFIGSVFCELHSVD